MKRGDYTRADSLWAWRQAKVQASACACSGCVLVTRMLMESMSHIWAEVKRGDSDAYTQMELGFKTILTGWDDEPDGKRM